MSADAELAVFEDNWDFTMTPDQPRLNNELRAQPKIQELKKPTSRKRSAKGARCTKPPINVKPLGLLAMSWARDARTGTCYL